MTCPELGMAVESSVRRRPHMLRHDHLQLPPAVGAPPVLGRTSGPDFQIRISAAPDVMRGEWMGLRSRTRSPSPRGLIKGIRHQVDEDSTTSGDSRVVHPSVQLTHRS